MPLDSFPPNACVQREQAIFDCVKNGECEITWATITSDVGGHHGEFRVFADALKIDGVRVNVSAQTEQLIADALDCMLLTARLADLIWLQRDATVHPHPRPITSTTAAMIAHSQDIDKELSLRTVPPTLISTVGKHWIVDNALLAHPGRAVNYGWHFQGNIGIPPEYAVTKDSSGHPIELIQGRGWAHDMHEVDYSQTCMLVSIQCTVDGNAMNLSDVLQDPALAPLACHDGVLKVIRQPGT